MRVELTSVDGTKSLRGNGFICTEGSLVRKYKRVVQVKNVIHNLSPGRCSLTPVCHVYF